MPIVLGCLQISPQPCIVTSSEREDADIVTLFFYNFGFNKQRGLLGSWIVFKYTASVSQLQFFGA